MIGKQFLTLGLLGLMMGGILALLVRWELAWPANGPTGGPVPGFGWVSMDNPLLPGGNITPAGYNAFFTMHATIMIFFAVMPILVGCFGNFLIPLMIGARDMAFPVLNMLSFWVGAVAAALMFSSFFVEGGPAAAGWTSYAPVSAVPVYTGVTWGQHLWCISLIVLGISSLMGSINYITTIINMRAPGMTWFRLPLVIWSLFITAILLLLSLPVLTSALGMLLFDRMAGTHFFLPPAAPGAPGGEPLLWQHLFWFFGHADAQRHRLRVDVRDRRALGHLHGVHAGRHLHPRHLLHRGPHPLRRLRGQHLRRLRRDLLLVPEDVRPHDERDARQDPLRVHLHRLQLDLLPDAHPRRRRPHASHLRSDAVRLPEAVPADEHVHHLRGAHPGRGPADPHRQLLLEHVRGQGGGEEPVAREHARVGGPVAAAARQFPGPAPHRVPGPVRVQLAAGRRGLSAAGAPARATDGRRRGPPKQMMERRTTGLHRFAVLTAGATVLP